MKRLFLRISLGIFLALVVSSVAASQLMRLTIDEQMHDRMRGRMFGEVDLMQDYLDRAGEEGFAAALVRVRRFSMAPVTVRRLDDPEIPPNVRADLRVRSPLHHPDDKGMTAYILIAGGDKVIVIGPHRRPLPFDWRHLLLVLSVVLPIVGAAGFLLAYPFARRLRTLEKAAQALREGDLRARAPIDSPDAVGSLAHQFNAMADKMQELLESQRHLMQAVAHELRTPIARIDFHLEMLREAPDEAQRLARAEDIENEIAELNELVGELLVYSRFDVEIGPVKKQSLPLPETVHEVVDRLRAARPEIDVLVRGEAEEVLAHETYFRRALQNLVANAKRYAKSQVIVEYERDGDGLRLCVIDDGPGVKEEDRQRIFEPFTRVDDSRSRESGGAGLGLAIVARICKAHGGSVAVADHDAAGTRFVTFWPAR